MDLCLKERTSRRIAVTVPTEDNSKMLQRIAV